MSCIKFFLLSWVDKSIQQLGYGLNNQGITDQFSARTEILSCRLQLHQPWGPQLPIK